MDYAPPILQAIGLAGPAPRPRPRPAPVTTPEPLPGLRAPSPAPPAAPTYVHGPRPATSPYEKALLQQIEATAATQIESLTGLDPRNNFAPQLIQAPWATAPDGTEFSPVGSPIPRRWDDLTGVEKETADRSYATAETAADTLIDRMRLPPYEIAEGIIKRFGWGSTTDDGLGAHDLIIFSLHSRSMPVAEGIYPPTEKAMVYLTEQGYAPEILEAYRKSLVTAQRYWSLRAPVPPPPAPGPLQTQVIGTWSLTTEPPPPARPGGPGGRQAALDAAATLSNEDLLMLLKNRMR